MKFLKICTLSILAFGISTALATAGMRCDEHAKKASNTKASSCATKTTKVSNASTVKAECTAAEKEACATVTKTATVKKVKNSSCCATKGKEVKTASVEATTIPAQANAEHVSTDQVTAPIKTTPNK